MAERIDDGKNQRLPAFGIENPVNHKEEEEEG